MTKVKLKTGDALEIKERDSKVICPLCKESVPTSWINPTSLDVVLPNGDLSKVPAMHSECCAQIYLELA